MKLYNYLILSCVYDYLCDFIRFSEEENNSQRLGLTIQGSIANMWLDHAGSTALSSSLLACALMAVRSQLHTPWAVTVSVQSSPAGPAGPARPELHLQCASYYEDTSLSGIHGQHLHRVLGEMLDEMPWKKPWFKKHLRIPKPSWFSDAMLLGHCNCLVLLEAWAFCLPQLSASEDWGPISWLWRILSLCVCAHFDIYIYTH